MCVGVVSVTLPLSLSFSCVSLLLLPPMMYDCFSWSSSSAGSAGALEAVSDCTQLLASYLRCQRGVERRRVKTHAGAPSAAQIPLSRTCVRLSLLRRGRKNPVHDSHTYRKQRQKENTQDDKRKKPLWEFSSGAKFPEWHKCVWVTKQKKTQNTWELWIVEIRMCFWTTTMAIFIL